LVKSKRFRDMVNAVKYDLGVGQGDLGFRFKENKPAEAKRSRRRQLD
jgi:hypothetical protein